MPKPQQIQELEKELNTTFEEVDVQEIMDFSSGKQAHYTTDPAGKIIGLLIQNYKLEQVPKNINEFKDLQFLNLSYNLISDISAISNLRQITKLYLRVNQISDISAISNLKQLTELDLWINEIRDISAISNLRQLTELNLSKNQISDISAISNLRQLTELSLYDNKINDISAISNLRQLAELRLESNQISDISVISNLRQLTRLFLGGNQISDISAIINLRQLTRLDLRNNPIEKLPKWICDFHRMDIQWENYYGNGYISFYDNPLKEPPIEIVKQGKEAIRDYFEQKKTKENEVKLILTGNSRAGKTSLLDFMQGKFDPTKPSTHGINIENYQWHEFSINAWDFGGQDYYHATHRLFLTNNSVYVLVWEQNTNKTNKKETKLPVGSEAKSVLLQNYDNNHWLTLIRKYDDLGIKNSIDKDNAHSSPVIMLQNKIDQTKNGNNQIKEYNENELSNYMIDKNNIFAVSILEYKSYKDRYTNFENRLKEIISQELSGRNVLEYDLAIRNAVRKRAENENIISFKDYKDLCNQATKNILANKISDQQISFATERLHNQGVLIYYGNISNSYDLQNNVFINPLYVTNTIYKILNQEVIENKGKFTFEHVKNVFLNLQKASTKNEIQAQKDADLFISLMQSPNFELIFKYNHEPNTYYATQYLGENLKDNALKYFNKENNTLQTAFVIEYRGFFSQSIMSRIIANYGFNAIQYENDNVFWKNGISFAQNKLPYLIYCKFEQKKIYVKAQNNCKKLPLKEIFNKILEISDNDKNIQISLDDNSFRRINDIKEYEKKEYWMFLDDEKIYEKDMETNNSINSKGNGNIILQGVQGNNINIGGTQTIEEKQAKKPDKIKKKILIIESQPKNVSNTDANNEIKKIDTALQNSNYTDEFDIKPKLAVNKSELFNEIDSTEPNILHFCIHTDKESGLIFSDNSGNKVYMDVEEFKDTIELYSKKKHLELVFINSCNSEKYAQAITSFTNYAIGMSDFIPPYIAVLFAQSFYKSFFNKNDIEYAFDAALHKLKYDKENELPVNIKTAKHEIPKLFKK